MSAPTPREATIDAVMTAYPEHKRREYRAVGERAVRDIEAAGLAVVRATDPAAGGDLGALADMIAGIADSDDLAAEGPALNALAHNVRALAAAPASEAATEGGDEREIDRRADAEPSGRTRDSAPSVLTLSTEDGQVVATVEQPEDDDVVAAARRALDEAGMPGGWYGLATAYGPTNPDHVDYVPAWLAASPRPAATGGGEDEPEHVTLAFWLANHGYSPSAIAEAMLYPRGKYGVQRAQALAEKAAAS